MFGAYRLALALLVAYFHLWDGNFAGPVAVFAFYSLSGYLMTSVVNERYADGVGGFFRFIANRALRIYPAYYVALVFGAAVVTLWPAAAQDLSRYFEMPASPLTSFSIVGLQPNTSTLVPPAWSLHVELLHYLAIAALLGRSRLMTTLWLVASVEYLMFASILHGLPFAWRYFDPFGASICFAGGAAIYHYREYLPRLGGLHGAMATGCVVGLALAMPVGFGRGAGLYLALAAALYAIVALKDRPEPEWGKRLGDLAYPVFLLHFPTAAAIAGIAGANPALAVVGTLLLSWGVVWWVERPLQRMRASLRAPATLARGRRAA